MIAWGFLAVAMVTASWAISSPLMSGPDEPNQVINAAAVVRGEFDHPLHPAAFGPESTVQVPRYIGSLDNLPACFAFKPSVPAGCSPPIARGNERVPALTQFSNYPPLYFALVGGPTLFLTGTRAVHAVRLMSVLINSILISLGLAVLVKYHPRRLPLLGALAALSPMVFYLSAIVSNSGMEVSAGFATWCAAICMIEHDRVPPMLAMCLGIAAGVLALSRPVSPAYLAFIIGLVACLAGWQRCRRLLGQRPVRRVGAFVAFISTIALGFILVDGRPTLLGVKPGAPISILAAAKESLGLTGQRLFQAIGDFGWLDTPSPLVTRLIWSAAIIALALLALATVRLRWVLLGLIVGTLGFVVALESPEINAIGTYWQGRYSLPLLVGVPLLASTARMKRGRHHRMDPETKIPWSRMLSILGPIIVLAGLFVAQLDAFLTALRRYEVGLDAPTGSAIRWQPPHGSVFVVSLFVVGELLLSGFILYFYTSPRDNTVSHCIARITSSRAV